MPARQGAGIDPGGAAGTSGAAAAAAAADATLLPGTCVGALQAQAALRDACSLQHASALAAAAPSGGPAAPCAPGAPSRPRLGELYNPCTAFGPDTRGSLRASAHACAAVAGAAHLLQAAAWHQYGAAGLSVAHALVHLSCYGGSGGSSGGGSGRGSDPGSSSGSGGEGQDVAAAWAQLVALAQEQHGGLRGRR
jgi:hypothetical protein